MELVKIVKNFVKCVLIGEVSQEYVNLEREREFIGRYICIFICMNGINCDQMVIDVQMYMYMYCQMIK